MIFLHLHSFFYLSVFTTSVSISEFWLLPHLIVWHMEAVFTFTCWKEKVSVFTGVQVWCCDITTSLEAKYRRKLKPRYIEKGLNVEDNIKYHKIFAYYIICVVELVKEIPQMQVQQQQHTIHILNVNIYNSA